MGDVGVAGTFAPLEPLALVGGLLLGALFVIGVAIVARRLRLARTYRWPNRIALVAHYRNVGDVTTHVEMHIEQDGFVGIADVGAGVTTVAAVFPRRRAREFAPERLWRCTLVTTVEPCAMCAGTQYWAHIGRLVYGMSERRLLELTGNHAENPTLDLPCREVFARGQKRIEVIGPVAEVEEEIAAVHRAFWAVR